MEISDYESKHIKSSILFDQWDGFYDVIFAPEINFNLPQFPPLNVWVGLRPFSRLAVVEKMVDSTNSTHRKYFQKLGLTANIWENNLKYDLLLIKIQEQ